MIVFTLKRLASGVVLLAVVSVATFFLAHIAISDPTASLLGTSATPAQQAALATRIGVDRPLLAQFADWFSHLVVGDLGVSWRNFQSVRDQLGVKVPVTLSVVALATLLTAVVGTAFGLIAGLNPGSLFDRVTKAVSVVLFALPGFWLGLVLVTWFAIQLKWFPAVGYTPPTTSVGLWLRSIILPAVALALGGIVAVAEQLRNAVLATRRQDWVRTLRSRGLAEWRVNVHILHRHRC